MLLANLQQNASSNIMMGTICNRILSMLQFLTKLVLMLKLNWQYKSHDNMFSWLQPREKSTIILSSHCLYAMVEMGRIFTAINDNGQWSSDHIPVITSHKGQSFHRAIIPRNCSFEQTTLLGNREEIGAAKLSDCGSRSGRVWRPAPTARVETLTWGSERAGNYRHYLCLIKGFKCRLVKWFYWSIKNAPTTVNVR